MLSPQSRGTAANLDGAWPRLLFLDFCLPVFVSHRFLRSRCCSIVYRFCLPTWLQKSTNIGEKSMPRCIPSWIPFLDRFLVDFCSQLPPIESQSQGFSEGKIHFLKTRLSNLTSIFDPIWVPTWLHFAIQYPQKSTEKSIPRGIKKKIDVGHFGSILASKLGPCCPLFRPKWGGSVGLRFLFWYVGVSLICSSSWPIWAPLWLSTPSVLGPCAEVAVGS